MQTFDGLIMSSIWVWIHLPNKTIVVSRQAFGYFCARPGGLTQTVIEGVEADAEPNAQEMKEITVSSKRA